MNKETFIYHVVIDERWQTVVLSKSEVNDYVKTYKLLNLIPLSTEVDVIIQPIPISGDVFLWEEYLDLLRSHQWNWESAKDKSLRDRYSVQEEIIEGLRDTLEDDFIYKVFC